MWCHVARSELIRNKSLHTGMLTFRKRFIDLLEKSVL